MSKHLAENRATMPASWTLAVIAAVMTMGLIVTGIVIL